MLHAATLFKLYSVESSSGTNQILFTDSKPFDSGLAFSGLQQGREQLKKANCASTRMRGDRLVLACGLRPRAIHGRSAGKPPGRTNARRSQSVDEPRPGAPKHWNRRIRKAIKQQRPKLPKPSATRFCPETVRRNAKKRKPHPRHRKFPREPRATYRRRFRRPSCRIAKKRLPRATKTSSANWWCFMPKEKSARVRSALNSRAPSWRNTDPWR